MHRNVALAFALMFGACTAAPDTGVIAAVSADASQICKRVTATGSNMPQRVCRTAEEWKDFERAGREGVEDMKRQTDALGTGGQLQ